MLAALSANHDDHYGGAARGHPTHAWTRRGLGTATPLGYAMVGGLILSQALTLYTTPVVFLYLDRVNRWLMGTKRPETAAENLVAAE